MERDLSLLADIRGMAEDAIAFSVTDNNRNCIRINNSNMLSYDVLR